MNYTSVLLLARRSVFVTRSITSSKRSPYIACCCAALFFSGMAAHDAWHQRQVEINAARGVIVAHVSATTLLAGRNAFLGYSKAPYTVVEFGDYECPYCRVQQKYIPVALDKYKRLIRFDFRQLPLYRIHPHAQEASLIAESGRVAGKFWTVHNRLFATDLYNKHAMKSLLVSTGLTLKPKVAQKQLSLDSILAHQLSVSATPSFFLCRPDGAVVRLPNLQAIDQNIGK